MSALNTRLKYVTRFAYGEALPTDEVQDGPIPVYGSNGCFASFSRANTGSPAIIVGRKGSYGKVNWTHEACFASDTTFVVDERTTSHHLRWLYWLLQALDLDKGSDEAAVPGLNRDNAYEREVLLPDGKIQRAIASFLDSETHAVDALIEAKQRLLDLLAEKRRTLVAEAVMRGLDRSAPLRPSGIDWLGDIPAHWEVRRLATLFTEKDERNEPDLPLLEVSINTGVSVRQFSTTQIEGTAADFNTYKVARKGSIAFNKMRMWQGAVGVTPTDGLISPDYVVADPSPDIDAVFAGLLFRTAAFSAECARNSVGITWDRLRLYWDGFRDITIGLPPLDEQRQIAERLGAEASKIDKLANATERSITLLKERRSALIAAAVTGQIAIPEAA
ncbi:restriction endonuclease subunit S [Novosphingobium sp. ERW19]|uniref:restriction endonuclease subunit S n=1 Tax=Novosphingobium sp. ERW19 TaxID=2726186 RepID=UPI0014563AD7|nr:restriction endonuclease subunit S [Novosphingobium sp. ERW19]